MVYLILMGLQSPLQVSMWLSLAFHMVSNVSLQEAVPLSQPEVSLLQGNLSKTGNKKAEVASVDNSFKKFGCAREERDGPTTRWSGESKFNAAGKIKRDGS